MSNLALLALVITGAPIVWRTVRGMLRGQFAADVVATMSILMAVILRQPVAGLVIVVMQTGGEQLEQYAARRASRALRELQDASPHTAHRVRAGSDGSDDVRDVRVDDVVVGDSLLVRPGELVPTDGVVTTGTGWVDTSRLTGESLPADVQPGAALMSGTINGDRPLTIRATAIAAESQYARIVQLVRSAQESKAPLQRLADAYAVWFTPVTIAVCVLTFALTRDWPRVLAVLVVATPCPLILATPVAMVGGISHAARHGIIVRHGGALEALAGVTVAVFDKTGTITVGHPEVSSVMTTPAWNRRVVMRLAAAVEQGSGHQLARSIVADALLGNASLPRADRVEEEPGRGVSGVVAGHTVSVGAQPYVAQRLARGADIAALGSGNAALRAFVAVDGMPVAAIEFADRVREGVQATFARMRALGVVRTMLLSGDQARYVDTIAREVGITEARGNLLPADKVAIVAQLEHAGERVLMIGDGVNDAPALSRADVGIALAAHGRGIASESADVVLLRDDVSGVADAIEIGRKTMRVARQSIVVGLGLSGVAMIVAAVGGIQPVVGAVMQEAIDVAVILNALRTSW